MEIQRAKETTVPKIPLLIYAIGRIWIHLRPIAMGLAALESSWLRRRILDRPVDRPVYICGLARAGSTVTLELLSRHPDVTTHRYVDMAMASLPYLWNRLTQHLPDQSPVERIHQDGIMVTNESPEGLEEVFWRYYFPHFYDEGRCHVLDAATSHPRFERYYRDHISKLLLVRGKTRYVTKGNSNVVRLEYLLKLFPDARFVLLIRNPVPHVVSYLKQHDLFTRIHSADRRWKKATDGLAHFEFGQGNLFLNTGSDETLVRIRTLWSGGERLRALGLYWSSIYGHLHDRIEANLALRRAVLIVRHEDLCADPAAAIDRILAHAGLDAAPFDAVKAEYVGKLRAPSYYSATLDPAEREAIIETTAEVAARFGYEPARRNDPRVGQPAPRGASLTPSVRPGLTQSG